MDSALGGQTGQGEAPRLRPQNGNGLKYCLVTRIFKSIPSLLDASFFFFLLCLLSAEGGDEFPSLDSYGNDILVLYWA